MKEITISDTQMRSESTEHTAARDAAGNGWIVPWLGSGLVLDRNKAITALTLAVHITQHWDTKLCEPVGISSRAFYSLVNTWGGELGITREQAIEWVCARNADGGR